MALKKKIAVAVLMILMVVMPVVMVTVEISKNQACGRDRQLLIDLGLRAR